MLSLTNLKSLIIGSNFFGEVGLGIVQYSPSCLWVSGKDSNYSAHWIYQPWIKWPHCL